METLLGGIAALLFLQWLFVWLNLRDLPSIETPAGRSSEDQAGRSATPLRGSADDGQIQLSVLIPARNEEGRIGDCVRSVLSQAWPALELLVLDDRSEDGTFREAGEAIRSGLKAGHSARVLRGEPLPPGITGKSHACMQLAREAKGRWLLFLDSDTVLGQGAIEAAMRMAKNQGEGLITGFPRQETSTWMERLVVPLMAFAIACHLPIRMVARSRNPAFVAAHGAFMLVHSDAYGAVGGHAALGNHLLDDMELARRIKTAGYAVTLANIAGVVSMRMYTDASGVWNGYRKNLFAGMGRSHVMLLAVAVFYGLLYLLPPAALAASIMGFGSLQAAALSICCMLLGMGIKRAVDRAHRQPAVHSLLLAPGIAALLAIAAASWFGAVSGRGYTWKGRRYK